LRWGELMTRSVAWRPWVIALRLVQQFVIPAQAGIQVEVFAR